MAFETPPPPGWAQDKLSESIETARHNTFATFVNLGRVWLRLQDVDKTFRTAIDNLHHARSWFAGFFLLRTHASYLGAVRLSVSGQVPEAYMVLRGCLENSLYGLDFHEHPESRETWLRRHDDGASRERVRNEFRIGAMLELLGSRDGSLGGIVSTLYDRTIDFGAHPNDTALFTNMRQTDEERAVRFVFGPQSSQKTAAKRDRCEDERLELIRITICARGWKPGWVK